MGAARAGREDGGAVQVGDAERPQVWHALAGVVQREVRVELDAVRGGEGRGHLLVRDMFRVSPLFINHRAPDSA